MIAYCENCRFYLGGFCRRYPPTTVPTATDNQHSIIYEPAVWWPATSPMDWCGEHKPKKKTRGR